MNVIPLSLIKDTRGNEEILQRRKLQKDREILVFLVMENILANENLSVAEIKKCVRVQCLYCYVRVKLGQRENMLRNRILAEMSFLKIIMLTD